MEIAVKEFQQLGEPLRSLLIVFSASANEQLLSI
jgi:hypothetical protein